MSGPLMPDFGKPTNVRPPVAGFGAMRDVDIDVPNLTTELTFEGGRPATHDISSTQEDITAKIRMNSLIDESPNKYKRGAPMFYYKGANSSSGITGRYTLLSLQNINEYMTNAAIWEARRFADLNGRKRPEWNERFFDMLYDPAGSLIPLGSMWTNDEGSEFRQREITMLATGTMTLFPNLWSIFNHRNDYVGFAIKLVPRSFTYAADGTKIVVASSRMKFTNGVEQTVPLYIPQIVPIIEDGNRGPCFCSDLEDIAKAGTERWNKELAFKAPRIYQRAPAIVDGNFSQHAADVRAFNAENRGTIARPRSKDGKTALNKDSDYDEMAVYEAPYFRFGQVLLTTRPLQDPIRSHSIDPITVMDRAPLTWNDDIKLRKAAHLLLSICRNPAVEWKR